MIFFWGGGVRVPARNCGRVPGHENTQNSHPYILVTISSDWPTVLVTNKLCILRSPPHWASLWFYSLLFEEGHHWLQSNSSFVDDCWCISCRTPSLAPKRLMNISHPVCSVWDLIELVHLRNLAPPRIPGKEYCFTLRNTHYGVRVQRPNLDQHDHTCYLLLPGSRSFPRNQAVANGVSHLIVPPPEPSPESITMV